MVSSAFSAGCRVASFDMRSDARGRGMPIRHKLPDSRFIYRNAIGPQWAAILNHYARNRAQHASRANGVAPCRAVDVSAGDPPLQLFDQSECRYSRHFTRTIGAD